MQDRQAMTNTAINTLALILISDAVRRGISDWLALAEIAGGILLEFIKYAFRGKN